METYYNRTKEEWKATREEIKTILIARAKLKKPIPYSELAALITTMPISAEDYALAAMLGEISIEENSFGRGMLSVIVIRKYGSISGPGFFKFAKKELGRDVSDPAKMWVDEFNKVCNSWAT